MPHPPCEIVAGSCPVRVVDANGEDVTQAFHLGASRCLEQLRDADCRVAVLKSKSPSCGSGAVYDGSFTGALVPGGVREQAEQVMKNLLEVLNAGGSGADRVLKTTCFLKSMDDFAAFNEVYARFMTSFPARSCVEVGRLPKGALVEVEAVAAVE